MAVPNWRRIAVQLALAGGAYYRLTNAERDALDDAVRKDWDAEWLASYSDADRRAKQTNESSVEVDEVITELAIRPRFYHRRGVTYWTGRHVWDNDDPAPLGVRHIRDARGVMWERRAGFWVRHHDYARASRFTWRCLNARYGPLTEIIRIGEEPDQATGPDHVTCAASARRDQEKA